MREAIVRLSYVLLATPSLTAALTLKGPLDTPDMAPYDPVELLCTLGREKDGKPKIQGWCKDWMACIKEKATPAGTPEAVRAAWEPADCKEICGTWPSVTPAEGEGKEEEKAEAKLFLLSTDKSKNACVKSCTNFQESLSSCVATIMYEPGKITTMGMPKDGEEEAPEICTRKDSPCMPDLEIKHQKCIGHKTKATLDDEYAIPDKTAGDCKFIKDNLEDCKGCPQLKAGFGSQYTTFVGGCMDQLNAYWQATNPKQKKAAIPGATSCTVH